MSELSQKQKEQLEGYGPSTSALRHSLEHLKRYVAQELNHDYRYSFAIDRINHAIDHVISDHCGDESEQAKKLLEELE